MEERRKVYVEVRARHLIDGTCRPETIKFENDEVYEIDRVKQCCRAASTKVGGTGLRYTVMICGKEIKCKGRVDGYDNFIFVNRNGDVQNQGNLNKAIQRMMRDCNDEILEKYGADSDPVLLPHFSCHILRHTFATRLCESGINLKVIQSVLGHADVSTTMNIYVDVTSSLKKKEIAAFGDYLASSSI